MMERVQGEQLRSTPDKFYLNEVKREVTHIDSLPILSEVAIASEFMDLDYFSDAIKKADKLDSTDVTPLINDNRLINQAWGFIGHCFEEVQGRRRFPDTNDFRSLIVTAASSMMRLDRVIDHLKIQAIGGEANTYFVNAFTAHVANLLSNSVIADRSDTIDPADATFAGSLSAHAFQKISIEGGMKSWLWGKTYQSAESMAGALNLYNVLSDMPEVSTADATMIDRHNQQLADASKELRTYTPKPAFAEIENSDTKILFVDSEIANGRFIIGRGGEPVTTIRLYHGADLTSSNTKLARKIAHTTEGGHGTKVTVDGVDPSTPATDMLIQPRDGRVTISGSSLAGFSKSLGMVGKGALLEAKILAQNFDLTVPTYIVDLANEEAKNTTSEEDDPAIDKLRRLLIARTRVLQSLGKDIADDIQNEQSESAVDHKDIIKHGVVGHLRRLPAGYQPSPNAIRLCKEQLGVDLPEGHTYVQIHERGTIEAPGRGHKIQKNHITIGKLGISA